MKYASRKYIFLRLVWLFQDIATKVSCLDFVLHKILLSAHTSYHNVTTTTHTSRSDRIGYYTTWSNIVQTRDFPELSNNMMLDAKQSKWFMEAIFHFVDPIYLEFLGSTLVWLVASLAFIKDVWWILTEFENALLATPVESVYCLHIQCKTSAEFGAICIWNPARTISSWTVNVSSFRRP